MSIGRSADKQLDRERAPVPEIFHAEQQCYIANELFLRTPTSQTTELVEVHSWRVYARHVVGRRFASCRRIPEIIDPCPSSWEEHRVGDAEEGGRERF